MPPSGKSLEKPPPYADFRSALQFYLIDCTTLPGKLIDILIVLLNMAVCAILVVETYPVSPAFRERMWQAEIIIVSVFILEYMARLYGARNRMKQMRDIYSIIDLVTILPTLILVLFSVGGVEADLGAVGIFRALRIFRILRFFRFTADPDFFFGRITYQFLRVLRLFLTIIIIFFISSILFYEVEHPVNASVSTFTDAFYFTVVALTTVGFGDITPLSEGGKWVTILMILSGIILIPWPISRIVKEWIHFARKRDIVCTRCGLRYHDDDASHCKSCGQVIYQEYDGG
jgi:voltage-gated potassium channel